MGGSSATGRAPLGRRRAGGCVICGLGGWWEIEGMESEDLSDGFRARFWWIISPCVKMVGMGGMVWYRYNSAE